MRWEHKKKENTRTLVMQQLCKNLRQPCEHITNHQPCNHYPEKYINNVITAPNQRILNKHCPIYTYINNVDTIQKYKSNLQLYFSNIYIQHENNRPKYTSIMHLLFKNCPLFYPKKCINQATTSKNVHKCMTALKRLLPNKKSSLESATDSPLTVRWLDILRTKHCKDI
jgi:hypothetical protein